MNSKGDRRLEAIERHEEGKEREEREREGGRERIINERK